MKNKLAALFVAPLVAVGLAGCVELGPSEEELQLIADCERVYNQMARTAEWPDSVDMDTWPDTYAVTNAGTESRIKAKADIQRMFPWMDKAMATIIEKNDWVTFQETYSLHEGYATALALNEITAGTSFAPFFSDAELEAFVTDEDAHYEEIENGITRLFDPYEDGSILGACPEYTSDSFVDGFNERYRGTISNARHAADQMRVLIACEINGAYDGEQCAATDYVSSGDFAPVEPRNPFLEPYSDDTTQGLAEFAWCWNLGLEVNPERTGCW